MGLFALWTTYFAIWILNLLPNQERRRIFIQAHLAIACKPCLKCVQYLVFLFLVWKPYWSMTFFTLLRFFRFSNEMDSTLRLTSALSTCSFLKYLYDFLLSAFSRPIFHSSDFTGIAVRLPVLLREHSSNRDLFYEMEWVRMLSMTIPKVKRHLTIISLSVRYTVLTAFSTKNAKACRRTNWPEIRVPTLLSSISVV